MVAVGKTTSDIQLEDGTSIVNIRVATISFTTASQNGTVHRPRGGLPQALQGHVTGGTVSIECDIDRSDVDAVSAMAGRSVVARFTNGGETQGILMSVAVSAEPASWQDDNAPYVAVSLTINAVSHVAGLG